MRQLDEILRTVVGSGLHGLAIDGMDDHDEMGVFIEPAEHVMGMKPPLDHDVQRTQPEGVRSGPGDTDLVRYSLRKYLRLAVQGNPTILLPLFAPKSMVLIGTPAGMDLRAMRGSIVSQQAGPRFSGYMHSQVLRLLGQKKRPTTRTELVEKYGYDTKFTSHALRLAIQGVELLSEGIIYLPMKSEHLTRLRSIKTGQVPEDEVLTEVEEWADRLERLVKDPPDVLPPKPDLANLSEWSISTHLEYWEGSI